jgi:hypothetical protein
MLQPGPMDNIGIILSPWNAITEVRAYIIVCLMASVCNKTSDSGVPIIIILYVIIWVCVFRTRLCARVCVFVPGKQCREPTKGPTR